MQKNINESWNKLCQYVNQPLADLTELNINTLNNWSKNKGHFDEITQAKDPADFLSTQMKLANIGQLEAATYIKKVSDILLKAIEEWNETYNEMLRDTAAKTQEVVSFGNKSKTKE